MKYSVSMSSNKKRRKRKPRKIGRRRFVGVSKLDRFKKMSGKKKAKTRSTSKKGFLGINKTKLRKFIYIALGVIFFIGCVAVLAGGIYLKSLRDSLPSPDALVERASDQSTKIFDRNGVLLYTVYGDQNREFVPIEDVPEYTKWAVLAAEDIEFYQHKGLDYGGIVMAAIQNAMARKVVRGGSTLTQQLVKNTLLYDILGDEVFEQTYSRKIKEILITMQVEQSLTKDQILQMYMNEIWMGDVNYGLQSASKVHFGKDVTELNLSESAMLAGMITNPSIFSPVYGSNPERAEERQDFVLDQMLKNSKITGVTEEEVQAAKEEEIKYKKQRTDIKAPHFVFYVRNLLEEEYGVDRVRSGGLEVTTSLDYAIQEIAEEEVIKGVETAHRYNLYNGALVAIDPNNGDVIAMVGSVDYWNNEDPRIDGNVNVATSLRQTGSSAKPYAYLAAITQGYGPWTEAPDLKMTFGGYKPVNWDRKYNGVMTARHALVQSRNLPAVYTLQLAGIDALINVVEKLGVTTLSDKANYGLSLALGSGEMTLLEHTAAFGVFANEGVRTETAPILKVETSSGEVLYEKENPVTQRVFDEKEIYALNYMLCDLGGHGDRIGGNAYNVQGKKVCYKTGTTNGPKDVLTMMYHPNLSVGVWGGNNNNEDMPGAWGSIVPLKIVHAFTQRVADQYPVGDFTRPSGILSTTVCKDTGKVPEDGIDCESEASIYIQGHGPSKDEREVVYICKANNLVAENLEAAQKYDLVEKYVFLNNTLENSLQQKTYDNYIAGAKDSNYITKLPDSGICPLPLGPNNSPVVEINSPTSGQSFTAGTNMTISGSIRVLESVDSFTVTIDGSLISGTSLNVDGTYSVTYSIPSDMSGDHTVLVSVEDNKGKSGSKSVNFSVKASTNSVNITSPADGVTVSFPVNLRATVSGTPTLVKFVINKSDNSYSTEKIATKSGSNWVATWGDGGGNGNYIIKAIATINGSNYESGVVTVTY
jgi:membrane peptidoglycan carboxypeptidase